MRHNHFPNSKWIMQQMSRIKKTLSIFYHKNPFSDLRKMGGASKIIMHKSIIVFLAPRKESVWKIEYRARRTKVRKLGEKFSLFYYKMILEQNSLPESYLGVNERAAAIADCQPGNHKRSESGRQRSRSRSGNQDNAKVFSNFSNTEVRRKFIAKVYGIVGLQLLVTTAIVIACYSMLVRINWKSFLN